MPALPAFSIQKACSKAITNHGREYYTGVVYTTNRRVWEYDDRFKEYLKSTRAMAVDMETASIAHVCYVNKVPFLSIRCITDTVEHNGVKNFEENCVEASMIAKDITVAVLKDYSSQHKLRQ